MQHLPSIEKKIKNSASCKPILFKGHKGENKNQLSIRYSKKFNLNFTTDTNSSILIDIVNFDKFCK